MTVVRGKQRSNSAQLADYLTEQAHELGQVRGVVATTAHEAIAELTSMSAGSRCRQELFHCSINPSPHDPTWTPAQYTRAWEVFEKVHGLAKNAFAEVWHSDDGRRHAHRVYSVVADGKAVKLSWSRISNELVGRQLEHEFGHRFLPGPNQTTVLRWLERGDETQRASAAAMRAAGLDRGPEKATMPKAEQEREQAERTGVAGPEIERLAAEAWTAAAGGEQFQAELKNRGLEITNGEKSLIFVDWTGNSHPAGRRLFVGLQKGDSLRAATHQAQATAIAAACPGPYRPLSQIRADNRRELPVAGQVPAEPKSRPAPEIDRLILAAWRETTTGAELRARLDAANLILSVGDRAGHWIVVDRTDPRDPPRAHDLTRSILAAGKAEGCTDRTKDVRPHVIARLKGLDLPTTHRTQEHQNGTPKDGSSRRAEAGRAQGPTHQSDARQHRSEPPPASRGRLHDLSEVELVRHGGRAELLLPDHVRDHVDHAAARTNYLVRRPETGGLTMSPMQQLFMQNWRALPPIASRTQEQESEREAVGDSLVGAFRGDRVAMAAAGLAESDIAAAFACRDRRNAQEQGQSQEDEQGQAAPSRQRVLQDWRALSAIPSRTDEQEGERGVAGVELVRAFRNNRGAMSAAGLSEGDIQAATAFSDRRHLMSLAGLSEDDIKDAFAYRERRDAQEQEEEQAEPAPDQSGPSRPVSEAKAEARREEARQATEAQQEASANGYGKRMEATERAEAYRKLLGAQAKITVQGAEVHVVLPGGQQIRDTGKQLICYTEGPAMARTLAEMAQARGWTEVRLQGSKDFKLDLARAVVALGITVKNPELAAEVKRFQAELANCSAMRPGGRERFHQQARSQPEHRQAQAADRRDAQPQTQHQPVRSQHEHQQTQAADRRVDPPQAQHQPSRSQAETGPVPSAHQVIERHAGRGIDTTLTRAVTAAVVNDGRLTVRYQGAELHHSRQDGSEIAGTLTADRARLMADLMVASGQKAVELTGSSHAKELLARAAVAAGLDVTNAEMRDFVDHLKAEQQRDRELKQNVASMKPAPQQAQERRPQTPAQSAPALQAMEVARLKRELAAAPTPDARYFASTRLEAAAQDEKTREMAENRRLVAAQEVVASGRGSPAEREARAYLQSRPAEQQQEAEHEAHDDEMEMD